MAGDRMTKNAKPTYTLTEHEKRIVIQKWFSVTGSDVAIYREPVNRRLCLTDGPILLCMLPSSMFQFIKENESVTLNDLKEFA